MCQSKVRTQEEFVIILKRARATRQALGSRPLGEAHVITRATRKESEREGASCRGLEYIQSAEEPAGIRIH